MTEEKNLVNGRYQIREELGRGGLGVIYQALDLFFNRIVAIKTLNNLVNEEGGCKRLFAEILSLQKLDHPNIIKIFDAGNVDQVPFIVMEYVEGFSLDKRPPESEKEIVKVALSVSEALVESHSNGVIHRDLKPGNIINSQNGNYILTDFGLAVFSDYKNENNENLEGTVNYISPEQALGNPVDGRSDLYSLGVMLYEFLCKELPFIGEDPLAVISAHVERIPISPHERKPSTSRSISDITMKLLQKHPDERFQSAADLSHSLKNIQEYKR